MSTPELEDLLARHFEGALEEDAARLDALLDADPDAARRFAGLSEIHGLLRARERSEADQDRLRDGVLRAVALEERRRRLTSRVLQTIGQRRAAPSRGPWPQLAAAAGILFLLFAVAFLRTPSPSPQTTRREPPLPAPLPPRVVEERPTPPAPEAAPAPIFEVPKPQPRTPAPPTEDATPVPAPVPAPAPKPLEPEAPRRTAPEAPAFRALAVREVRGLLTRKRDGKALEAGSEIARSDLLMTSPRRGARVSLPGFTVTLERGSAVALEQEEGGAVRATISEGTVFFEVEKRTAPFAVNLNGAEALVVGTSFQAERASLSVLEGAVRLRNEKGDVLVRAGQRATLRPGEKPGTPSKADVDALAAWRRRPELLPNPDRSPYLEREPGSNRKLPGLVLAAPYGEGEPESEKLARLTAERLDAALVVGHHYRDVEKRRWINVDRAMEADLRADGTPEKEVFTDRARKATGEYLDQLRAGAGVGPRDAVPLLVQFRNHYEPGLDACEVAVAGWSKPVVAGLKALYAQLLEKHKPAFRPELRFQGVDDAYESGGLKRTFSYTEADARIEGALAPKNTRNGITLFLSPAAGKRTEDLEALSKILAEMVEYLQARRK